ncbi:MAG: DUF4327 family protein [Pleurocapsa sp.]
MITNATVSNLNLHYSIDTLKEEINYLLDKKIINRHQPLYVLLEYLPAREWFDIECELERCDYLLRDRIGDLVGDPQWHDD